MGVRVRVGSMSIVEENEKREEKGRTSRKWLVPQNTSG
jgi:hypothetical protein